MKTVLHLARKDLTRHWIPALLVLVAIALDALDTRYGFAALSVRNFPDGLLGSLVKWPLCYLFVVAIVQEDRVIDPRAHWLTRPVPPLALLGAKLLVSAIVVIGPLALAQTLLAHSVGAEPSVSLAIAAEVIAGSSVLVLLAVLVASLTRTIIESCVFVGGILLLWLLAIFATSGGMFDLKWLPRASRIDGGSRFVVVAATAIPALLALLVEHYRRRSFGFTLTLSLTAAAAVTVLAHQFPWQVLPQPAPRADETVASAEAGPALQLSFKLAGGTLPGSVDFVYDRTLRRSVPHHRVAVLLDWRKSRPDRLISKVTSTTTLHFPDGTQKSYAPVLTNWDDVDLALALRGTLEIHSAEESRPLLLPLNLFTLAPGEDPIPPGRPGRATTVVRFVESRLDAFLRQPATKRTSFVAGSTLQVSPLRREADDTNHVIELRQFVLTSLVQRGGGNTSDLDLRRISAVLHHPTRNEFAIGKLSKNPSDFAIGNVRPRRFEFLFDRVRSNSGSIVGVPTAEWLAGAELVLSRSVPVAPRETKLEFDNLSFDADRRPEPRLH